MATPTKTDNPQPATLFTIVAISGFDLSGTPSSASSWVRPFELESRRRVSVDLV